MAEPTLEELLAEQRRRTETRSTESVMDKPGTTYGEFLKGFEAIAKGIPKGILNLIGGPANLYDVLSKSKDPSALSTAGIVAYMNFLKLARLQPGLVY